MSYQGNGVDITLLAAADLSAKQFYAVKVDSNGAAAVAGAGEFSVGIVQNDPTSGKAATVRVGGISKATAGDTINKGDLVAANASGKLVVATKGRTKTDDTGAAVDALLGSNVLGVALEGASGDGIIFPVLITHSGSVPTTAS